MPTKRSFDLCSQPSALEAIPVEATNALVTLARRLNHSTQSHRVVFGSTQTAAAFGT
jgi:hypothetical protein